MLMKTLLRSFQNFLFRHYYHNIINCADESSVLEVFKRNGLQLDKNKTEQNKTNL